MNHALRRYCRLCRYDYGLPVCDQVAGEDVVSRSGWMYKNVEPSELALRVPRVSGVVGLIIFVAILIWAVIDLLFVK